MTRKSPIRLCPVDLFGGKRRIWIWKCSDEDAIGVIRFARGTQSCGAIVHRSAMRPGLWQLTWTEGDTPTGHILEPTLNDLIKMHGRDYRLVSVMLRDGTRLTPK